MRPLFNTPKLLMLKFTTQFQPFSCLLRLEPVLFNLCCFLLQIVVYSITGCPHCNAAKLKLKELNLNFVDVSVDRFPPYVREWLATNTGKTRCKLFFICLPQEFLPVLGQLTR